MASIDINGKIGAPVNRGGIGRQEEQPKKKKINPLATDYTQLAQNAIDTDPDVQTSRQYLDEYQRLADAKDYSTLLDKAISDYNMKVQTQKYMNNTLANSGLDNSGYAQSMQAGTQNAYMNLLGTDYSAYAQSIAQNENDALDRQKETDEQLVTYLNAAQDAAQVASVMSNYGYTRKDNGQWVDRNGNPASSYVSAMADLANANNGAGGKGYTLDEIAQISSGDNYGSGTMNDTYGNELQAIRNKANRNELKPNEVIMLQSGKGGNEFLRVNSDGTYSRISMKEWLNSNNGDKSIVTNGKWVTNKNLINEVISALKGDSDINSQALLNTLKKY